jgi:Arc/MetJ-type ribon-helix-helix transcriptional regulator
MPAKPVTVTIDAEKLERLDAWVRAGRYENRSRAIDAALELLERRNARPTLEWALAHPLLEPGSPEWDAAERESEAIDAFADALNQADNESESSPAA